MNEITLKNYRCFRERQSAKLAPLTLLVGENSTGKTSFLALIRALTYTTYGFRIPDFREEPYDLGSFDEIAHVKSGRGERATTFEAGFSKRPMRKKGSAITLSFTFAEKGTAPAPTRRRLSRGQVWIDEIFASDRRYVLEAGTSKGRWKFQSEDQTRHLFIIDDDILFPPSNSILRRSLKENQRDGISVVPVQNSPPYQRRRLQATVPSVRLSVKASARAAIRQRARPLKTAPHL